MDEAPHERKSRTRSVKYTLVFGIVFVTLLPYLITFFHESHNNLRSNTQLGPHLWHSGQKGVSLSKNSQVKLTSTTPRIELDGSQVLQKKDLTGVQSSNFRTFRTDADATGARHRGTRQKKDTPTSPPTQPNISQILAGKTAALRHLEETPTKSSQIEPQLMVDRLKNHQRVVGGSRYLMATDFHHVMKNLKRQDKLLPFGFVMKEFAQRILSRHIAQSNVVIVGPLVREPSATARVGFNLLQHAREENHTTHELHVSAGKPKQSLDEWWNAMSQQNRPDSIILTVIDLDQGYEDEAFSSPTAASVFLGSGPTMTYIVVGVTASTGGAVFAFSEYKFEFGGRETVTALLKHNYKVQLLSASDFWYSVTGNPLSAKGPVFRPNDLITESNLDEFFEWGARSAAFSEALVKDKETRNGSSVFKAYLFATQGLDLAIPSRREYLVNGQFKNTSFSFIGDIDFERKNMVKRVPFKNCFGHNRVKVGFRLLCKNSTTKALHPLDVVRVFCDGRDVSREIISKKPSVKMWMNTNDPATSESFCVKVACDEFFELNWTALAKGLNPRGPTMLSEQVACATRIVLPKQTSPPVEKERPNLLVLMINSISRSQFDFLLPRTKDLLRELNFTRFGNYTTVSDNSGPNQAALYAGKLLVNGDGIDAIKKSTKGIPSQPWLWDELRAAGYATFKAKDECIVNSNMVRSLQPNMTHGQALHELFCFHFNRPNCVGQKLAADYLLNHAQQFINVYSNPNPLLKQPWSTFLSLTDSHEDSMTLGGIIDKPIEIFLKWAAQRKWFETTLVVVVSDRGLHYGPYFQSKAGEKERSEPVLYMKLPGKLNKEFGKNARANKDKWVTPFDVHETFLEALDSTRKREAKGVSLLQRLPISRTACQNVGAIPDRHCELLDPSWQGTSTRSAEHDMPPSPPSILSFYADIPRDHRLKQIKCPVAKEIRESTFLNRSCTCATSSRDWFECKRHPWAEAMNESNPDEYFAMVDCESGYMKMDSRVVRQNRYTSRLKEMRRDVSATPDPPNILFIEIDSVSIQYADRHFPKTRELMRRHHARVADNDSSETCRRSLCAVEFTRFSGVGPNSIANQVAALSGCLTTHYHKSCFHNGTGLVGDICLDQSLFEYGMRLRFIGPNLHTIFCPANATDPYLYDVAKTEGYFSFFGEEFCYQGSPWVLQDVVFPLRADVKLDSVFCRLASRRNRKSKIPKNPHRLFTVNLDGCHQLGVQTHTFGLEQIRQIWDAYHDVPKFAYLNAIAAHRYTDDWSAFPLDAEAYDEDLSRFLESFLSRPDANRTIIVLRSDHGFQGGNTMPIDYSTQIEHKHPWTEIIVPDRFPVGKLLGNRDKVATSYDLYKTIRDFMSGSSSQHGMEWAYNLVYDSVPNQRTCPEARIPRDMCLLNEPPPPTFGVCNTFEKGQAVFCLDPTLGAPVGRSPSGVKASPA